MMLQIILLILKIIGWIVLAILGVMVLLVCVTVFTPLRYEVFGKGDGDLASLNLKVKFSWFFHLISGTIQYADEKLVWKLRIAWKKLDSRAEETAEETMEKAAGEFPEEIKEKSAEAKTAEKKLTDPGQEEHQDAVRQDKKECAADEKPEKENPIPGKKRKEADRKTAAEDTDGFFDKTAYKFELLCGKIKELIRKKEIVVEFLTDEIHKAAFIKGIRELKRMVLGLKPEKVNGNIEFGTGDPALTGRVLAGVSVLYPYFADNIQFVPDFEKKTLKGDCYMKGRAAAKVFVSLVLRLLLDKNIRITIRHAKKFKLD